MSSIPKNHLVQILQSTFVGDAVDVFPRVMTLNHMDRGWVWELLDRIALEMWSLAQILLVYLVSSVGSTPLSVLLQYTCVHPVQMAS